MTIPPSPAAAAPAISLHVWLDRAGRRPYLALLAVCLTLWLPGLWTLPPTDRDESRFAQASKQMIETGDYVRIRIGTVARNQKPIGIYWLQVPFAAAARALGVAPDNPIWPYRLPSLAGGLIAVLATYGFGRGLVGTPAALLGAALLAGCLVLGVEVRTAKTDAALLGATTLAMGVLSRAWLDPRGVRWGGAMGFWAALGAAILIKGPIAPMVCGLAAVTLAVLGRRNGPPRWLWALRPGRGVWLLAAIVLPWSIAIGLATHGRFFAQSVGGDLAGKLAGADDAHGAPFGTHLLLLPGLMFAGGVAAFAAVPSTWRARDAAPVRFLIAWIVPSWLVFELVATKLPHYTLPLYPPVALLAARWMLEPPGAARIWPRIACGLAVVLTIGLAAAAVALPLIAAPAGGWVWLGAPAVVVAAVLAVALWRAWPDARRASLAMLIATPLLSASVLGWELPRLTPLWLSPRVAQAVRAHWPGGAPAGSAFGALGYAEPSLMFLCGTGTRLFGTAPDAAAFLTGGPDRVLVADAAGVGAVQARLHAAGWTATAFTTVTGYTYSRGRRITLDLLTAAPRYKMK